MKLSISTPTSNSNNTATSPDYDTSRNWVQFSYSSKEKVPFLL